jgi:Raf kinase inhibitor-like YbhB/YbcL family protein
MGPTLVRCVTFQIITLLLIHPFRAISATDAGPTLALTSSAFQNGGPIPERCTCSGSNKSPELEWSGVSADVRSLTLILDDPDAPMGTFVHWVLYNVSPFIKGLPEGMSASASVGSSEQGVNGQGEIGYTGPCPPPGKPHHYHFRLYALDRKLELKPGATKQQVEAAVKGHVLSSTELVGIFER